MSDLNPRADIFFLFLAGLLAPLIHSYHAWP